MKNKYLATLIFLLLVAIMLSCSIRNDHGALRVPMYRFAIKPSLTGDIYSIIDTTVLYENVKLNGLDSLEYAPGFSINIASKKNSMKFYANGRMANFQNVDFNVPESINPADAVMGMYGRWGKKPGYYLQYVSQSAQAGIYLLKQQITIDGDTLHVKNASYDEAYVKRPIPKTLLKFKPDW